MTDERVQVKIQVPQSLKFQLDEYAKLNKTSVNATLTTLIENYCKENAERIILELYKHGVLKMVDNG